MTNAADSYFGVGVYSMPEAAVLTGVPASRVRRWLRGYDYERKGKRRHSAPVWRGQLRPIGDSWALGFQDLIELRFIDAFLQAGVSWRTLRRAHDRAAEMVDSSHPFCTRKFRTEGRHVFADVRTTESEAGLIDVIHRQGYFDQLMRPVLLELEFARADKLLRWWPLGTDHQVVLDPTRSFGRPIVSLEGVPTAVLYRAVRARNTEREVREWFNVSAEALADALEFERRLAA